MIDMVMVEQIIWMFEGATKNSYNPAKHFPIYIHLQTW